MEHTHLICKAGWRTGLTEKKEDNDVRFFIRV